jgi:hypothetical protein
VCFEAPANRCEPDRLALDFNDQAFEPSVGTEAVTDEPLSVQAGRGIFHRSRQLFSHLDYGLRIRRERRSDAWQFYPPP